MTAHASVRHARVLSEIVRAILPSYPELEPVVKATVHTDVTAFVASQIEAIPSFLRLPYKLALVGFNLLPLLRWARPFVRLRPEARASYVTLWSDGPIGAMRDFMKLIRSCALLAYFDHPEVARLLDARCPPKAAASTSVELEQRGIL